MSYICTKYNKVHFTITTLQITNSFFNKLGNLDLGMNYYAEMKTTFSIQFPRILIFTYLNSGTFIQFV